MKNWQSRKGVQSLAQELSTGAGLPTTGCNRGDGCQALEN